MAPHLLLIRHGESVDNVAGLYAGSRDSSLTNHGVLQARRLGSHLADNAATLGPIEHIFASNLQRAVKTAEAVAQAQLGVRNAHTMPQVVQLPMLREKDFGSEEGMRFGAREIARRGASSSATWVEPESRQSMKRRVDRFLDDFFLATATRAVSATPPGSIAIVSHGIILNVLLRCLLMRFGPGQMVRFAKAGTTPRASEWLASWSNTGYLVLEMRVLPLAPLAAPASLPNTPGLAASVAESDRGVQSVNAVSNPVDGSNASSNPDIQLSVKLVNCTDHLQGLKKTRSGIGSACFDEKQKTLDSFFSRAPPK
ncbi:histidine phosphatase superfamily [Coniella lustricola]|uniref:Histidine phosphatase superfamily n=1 Tax=Coniella lustricola TaxID=2025994 RepID=A0A2T3A0J7_9PEZI|nr:histidine phosphatase superfamily [Coniella lustricola]